MKQQIEILVENRTGVLSRISGMFSRRGFNIDRLEVHPTEDPTVSVMKVETDCDAMTLEQIRKQLGKMIDTIKVTINQ
ncbi:MAG: acetolactate synthase small subunit [Ruminococcus sp.]|jgi:acetolactate synthase-1/3 small subunit|nr:acetolactate synthase small subunit [Ruminococcus sp.]